MDGVRDGQFTQRGESVGVVPRGTPANRRWRLAGGRQGYDQKTMIREMWQVPSLEKATGAGTISSAVASPRKPNTNFPKIR